MKNIIYSIINLNIQEYNQITFKNKHHYFFGLLKSAIALRWGKHGAEKSLKKLDAEIREKVLRSALMLTVRS